MKRSVLFYLIFILILTGLYSENNDEVSLKIQLFGDESAPPVTLDSRRGWTEITSVDLNLPGIQAGNAERKWRLHTSYEHSRSSSPTTIQIRLRNASAVPTFTHPWSEGADVKADVFSNWYEDPESLTGEDTRFVLEARFITAPRTPVTGKIYSITLEAQDVFSGREKSVETRAPDVQLAYARPLPTERPERGPASRQDEDADNPQLSPEAALAFSLSFVEACITGDLPRYYRSQSDPVRSLDDGKAMARYRLNPPKGIPGIATLDDYKRRFNYRIYSSAMFSRLFPEWFDTARPWVPGGNSFLFMGHQDRLSTSNTEDIDYLVFLVEADDRGEWKVVARPGK